jgi:hypothetical protein
MRKCYSYLFRTIICIAVALSGSFANQFEDTGTHLDKYSEYIVKHHDNIDDTSEDHSHKHKHSEDGEEHEHNHNHVNYPTFDFKIVRSSSFISLVKSEFESSQGFSEKFMISNSYPLEIFRPPIS